MSLRQWVGSAVVALIASGVTAALVSAREDRHLRSMLEEQVAGSVNLHLEVLASMRLGRPEHGFELLEKSVDRAVTSTVAQGWARLRPPTQQTLKTARLYRAQFPLSTQSGLAQAAYAAIPTEPPESRYCTNAVRDLLGIERVARPSAEGR